jgi:hypothetical protein
MGFGGGAAPYVGLYVVRQGQGYAPCTAAETPGSATLGSLHYPDPLCARRETECPATRSMEAPCSRGCPTACAPVAAPACTRDDSLGARGSAGSQRCTIVHKERRCGALGSAGSLAHLCIEGGHSAGRSYLVVARGNGSARRSRSRQPPAANRQPPAASRQPPAASRQPPAASRQPPAASRQPPAASRDRV